MLVVRFVPLVLFLSFFVVGCGGGGGVRGVGANANDFGVRVPIPPILGGEGPDRFLHQVRVQLPAAGEVRQSARLQKIRRNVRLPQVDRYSVTCMQNGAAVSTVDGYPGDIVVVMAPDGASTIVVQGFDYSGTLVARGEQPLNIVAGTTETPSVSVQVNWVARPVAIEIIAPPAITIGSLLFSQTGQLTDGQITAYAPAFDFTAGQRYFVQLTGPANADFDVYIQPAGLGALDWDRMIVSGTRIGDEFVEFTPPTTGRYDIFVDAYSGAGSFTLRVTRP